MQELIRLLRYGDEEARLDVAALELASIEFPELAIEPSLDTLESLAQELGRRVEAHGDGRLFVAAANAYLFEELGFHGNESDYYDPRNSCLNEVLRRRTGIPITLSIVYTELARRLGRTIHGIGLPGHFIVRYDDAQYATYIDPFHGGRLLTRGDCIQLARDAADSDVSSNPSALAPVTRRQILVRMLHNLRAAYVRREEWAKCVRVLDLLLEASPDSAEEYRQRGLLEAKLERFPAARRDLETFLRLAPAAEDRAEVEEHLGALRRWLASWN